MVDLTLKIKDIDYEKTVKNFWPMIKAAVSARASENLALRFLCKLNDTPLTLFESVLDQIPKNKCGELLSGMITLYGSELAALINDLIKSNLSGNIVLGGIEAKYSLGETVVTAANVKVNYKALVKDEAVNCAIMQKLDDFPLLVKKGIMTFIKGISGMSEDKIEKGLTNIANTNVVKNWLLNLIKGALNDHGIVMEVSDAELRYPSSSMQERGDLADCRKCEDELLDAAVGYINKVFAENACGK